MTQAPTTPEAPAESTEQKISAVNAKIAQAEKDVETYTTLLSELFEGKHGEMSLEDKLAISPKLTAAQNLLANQKDVLKSIQSAAVREELDKLLNPLDKSLQDAVARIAGLREKLGDQPITFTITPTSETKGEGESAVTTHGFKVSHRVASAPSTPKPAGTSDGATGGTRPRMVIVADGQEFGSKDYVFKYFDAGKAAGYSTSRESASVVPPNEYAKIAPVLAAKLGHTVKGQ